MKRTSIILCVAAFAMLSLTNCASDSSTDQEISQAQAAVAAADFGLDIAEMAYTAKMADPSTDPITRLVAAKTMEKARTHLAEEKAKLAAIQQKRLNAFLAATPNTTLVSTSSVNPLLPPLTAAK
ncbi:MAG: hypothetical protein ABL974_17420 [Prosthecobacter sp.]